MAATNKDLEGFCRKAENLGGTYFFDWQLQL